MVDSVIAVVVGGASGIGWATAQLLAATGYRVTIADRNADLAAQRAGDLGDPHTATAVEVTETWRPLASAVAGVPVQVRVTVDDAAARRFVPVIAQIPSCAAPPFVSGFIPALTAAATCHSSLHTSLTKLALWLTTTTLHAAASQHAPCP